MSEEVEEGGSAADPRVVGVDSDDADSLIGALSSDTARDILACLDDEEGTPSEIAERLDTSIQNVRYHLDGLEDAGLVDVTDMRYSPKGREMNVYDVASGPVVVFPGRSGDAGRLRRALTDLLAGVAVVGAGAAVLQRAWTALGGPTPAAAPGAGAASGDSAGAAPDGEEPGAFQAADNRSTGGDDGGMSIESTADAPTGGNEAVERAADTAGGTGQDLVSQLVDIVGEPGVAFLLGGFVALLVAAALRYRWGD
jgi:DNA-binding transcriptional ArsR family regulator